MALLRNVLITGQILSLASSYNLNFFPCDIDINHTTVDCSDRKLTKVPDIKSNTVVSLDLSGTQIGHIEKDAFAGVQHLQNLSLATTCRPDQWRILNAAPCSMIIDRHAFMTLQNLTYLNLSRNSLTSIPWLPETLKVLDLQYNCIVHISEPLKTPNLVNLVLTGNCFYANPCDRSLYINESVFRELPKLKTLKLGYNNLSSIPKGLPPSLETLDLRENAITEVLDSTFSNFPKLRKLTLEWNCQRCDHAARPCFPCPNNDSLKLYSKSFYAENSTITYLSLRGNSLKKFPEAIFRPLKNLKQLDLSDNLLMDVLQNGTFFADLKSLTWLSMIYNYEPKRTHKELNLSASITSMSHLQFFLLSGNFFHRLSDQSFYVLSQLKNLTTLELRMNFIDSCNLTALTRLPSLTHIDLSQNMLSFLPCSIYHASDDIQAQTVSQSRNLYTQGNYVQPLILRSRDAPTANEKWESDQFNLLLEQKDTGLSFHPLWHFKKKYCSNKLTVDLSQNNLISLNSHEMRGMENVVCMDLSFNYMNQAIKGGYFNNTQNLAFLNLSYNRLDLYYKDALGELSTSLKVLDLSNNDFHFNMKGMGHSFHFLSNLAKLKVLNLGNNGIGMRIDVQLVSSSIEYLYFYGNRLGIMWQPNNNVMYTSFFQQLTSLTYLDISNNYLTIISADVLCKFPRTIRALVIRDNQLIDFPWQNLSALVNLSFLDLCDNKLSCLPDEVISFGANLSHLDISHNAISSIPSDFFREALRSLKYLYLHHNRIEVLDHQSLPSPFGNGSGLKRLSLHNNPFRCDCETSWFVDFLSMTPIHIPQLSTSIHCGFPEAKLGQSILTMDKHSCQDIYGGLAFLVCFLLAVTFTVLPLLKHLYGWDLWYCIQVLWAGMKGYSQLAGTHFPKSYDAFVVFDTSNHAVRDWVYNELTANLENVGRRRFSLCLEERDWIPGLSCIDNLHNAINGSVKTMFVLSSGETVNGVIRQAFYMVQQRLLDEKVDVAVLVLLDEMFPKLKYLQLRKRLCKKSVLTWPKNPKAQPLFWNQIRMILSSDNLKFYDSNMSESFT